MGQGPLDHPRLLAIEHKLDAGELDEAQKLLAELGDVAFFRYATGYLATRLLFLRGKLAPAEVAQRLRDLLRYAPPFPQANALLQAAEAELDPDAPQIEVGELTSLDDDEDVEQPPREPPSHLSLPSIPKAAPVPQFTPPPFVAVGATSAQAALELPALELPEPAPISPRVRKVSGRYSETPPPPAALGARPVPRPTGIESFVRAAPAETSAPTLFEIATLLDSGRADEALAALESASLGDAEAALMRARALAQLDRRQDALDLLGRLRSAPLLDPELRAGVARLLLELGNAAEALSQARRAHADDPNPPIVRLTLAWAAVRALRRGADPRLAELASELVTQLKSRGGPRPDLVLALRACLIADADPEQAILAAQRALSIDYASVDALVALALGSARLGRVHDARRAYVRLSDLGNTEAEFVARVLAAQGIDVAGAEHAPRPGMSVSGDDVGWDPAEIALLEGRRDHTITVIEELCKDTLTNVSRARGVELPTIGTVAASLFTTAPVFRDFAPYDLSLWSIARIDAALAVLYGREPRPRLESDDYSTLVLVGAYVGEALRQSHDGKWRGTLGGIDRAVVRAKVGYFQPFRLVKSRIREAIPISADDTLHAALAHPGSDPWQHRLPCPIASPCPWDPAPWPDPAQIDVLGRALSRSMIGLWCERFGGGPLDRSLASLAALDAYLGLVSPTRVTPAPDEVWIRRVAVLSGAYLGEVLRSAAGGEWVRGDGDELGAKSYQVVLGSRVETTPIAHALSRITERGASFRDYARKIVRAG